MKKIKGKGKAIVSPIILCSIILIFTFVIIENIVRIDKNEKIQFFCEESAMNTGFIEYNLKTRLDRLGKFALMFSDFQNSSEQEIIDTLNARLALGSFAGMMLVDIDSNVYSTLPYEVNLDLTDKHFKLAFSGVANVSGTMDIGLDFLTNTFSIPVYDSNNNINAIICAFAEENYLSDMMKVDYFNRSVTEVILDESGNLIVAPAISALNFSDKFNLFAHTEIYHFDEVNLLRNLSLKNASGNIEAKLDDTIYYIYYQKLNKHDWYSVYFLPKNQISLLNEYNNSMLIIIICLMSALMIAVIVRQSVLVNKLRISSKNAQQEIERLLFVDQLTGFDSNKYFMEKAVNLLENSTEFDNFALISMDINNFRAVNDFLGHEGGNTVLSKLADLVNRNVRDGELFVRMNADTFLMLMPYQTDSDIIGKVENVINDIYYQITEFRLIMAVGIYKIEDKKQNIHSIIDRAGLARRTVKNQNDSAYAFFNPLMLSRVREEKAIENIMEEALDSKEFVVFLQPKYDLHKKNMIVGAEALVRWKHDGKVIPPGNFISLFEKNGFITKLDTFVFEEVCKQQKIWMSRGLDIKVISVNVSRINLKNIRFANELSEICNRYNVPTKYIEIEITESAVFEDLELLIEVISEFKAYGFNVSIDDFGSGYSSLNTLKDLAVDVLKIDRAFLTDSDKNKRAGNIIEHVISLAVSLNMKTICEGIETREQEDLLIKMGCDMAQGFYYARPMPIGDYEKLLYGSKLYL